ncbi:MAG: 30S ribosomal protein S8 [SAR116 cluster bacterium MED-G04]|jgi:small subunit ribosomal protein S8|nr:30S ribosomal protein S8 [SAR116 cluster bacterium]PDH63487.1 MAG: 30S ribosomal protein S8 [SAR116 cluster bacterium MED-G04]CAI8407534.1 MAG: 30S ribosomal protein S8 [SAR116 cluster bacterium MED-G04]HCD49796.1 30S ribosomal protein S8 [Alphaproteobacteria bacterium]HCV62768.1 30S ribosomal protein S8 [Alphaproteobacteria bacterium]
MTMSDPLGDMLTRIRNGQSARKDTVISPASRFRLNVLDVLKREGYIRDYSRVELRPGVHELKIELKYHDGLPVISEIQRVSRPGRRVYSKIKDLTRVYNGLGIAILSTPRGVMSDLEAREAKVGGEILCHVF